MRISSFSILCILLIIGCENTPSDQKSLTDCPYPTPVAIFSDTLSAVVQHQFSLKDMEALEEVTFHNGMGLTLIQSGCKTIRQEFQFRLPGNSFPGNNPEFWVGETLNQLQFLTSLGPQYLSLNAWGQAIDAQKEHLVLGEPTEIQIGFYAEIDKIISADHAILLLILSEKP